MRKSSKSIQENNLDTVLKKTKNVDKKNGTEKSKKVSKKIEVKTDESESDSNKQSEEILEKPKRLSKKVKVVIENSEEVFKINVEEQSDKPKRVSKKLGIETGKSENLKQDDEKQIEKPKRMTRKQEKTEDISSRTEEVIEQDNAYDKIDTREIQATLSKITGEPEKISNQGSSEKQNTENHIINRDKYQNDDNGASHRLYRNNERQRYEHNSERLNEKPVRTLADREELQEMINDDSLDMGEGILEIFADGYGYLRTQDNYKECENDIYISQAQIRRFSLKQGDRVKGKVREPRGTEKLRAIIFIKELNGIPVDEISYRKEFETLKPTYPTEKIILENGRDELAPRIIDIMCPIGKGQRAMIVAPPRAGKTSVLKSIANSIRKNNPEMELIILLVDERPEEVTDISESVDASVVASTFDQEPLNHIRVAEMTLARAKRIVESGKDVVVLMDSLTRLARAYNLTMNTTGRSLSGGLDPGALYGPKNFFGAARNIREGGSLTIIATALVETGSRMDDVIFEEFKGTGNMELVLDRKLAERRIYPAIDIYKSATRKEELLLSDEEMQISVGLRKTFGQKHLVEFMEDIISLMKNTKTNSDFIKAVSKTVL